MARIIDLGKTRYQWVPGDDGIADVSKPTVAELNAGVNISPFTVQSTAIMAAASDTVNERAVTDTSNAVVPTIGNYTGNLVLFRDGDNETGEFEADDLFSTEFATRGILGFIVKRTGLPHDTAFAAAQSVEVYKFMTDNPVPSGGAQDGYLKLVVPLLPQGAFDVRAVIAAAAAGGGGI